MQLQTKSPEDTQELAKKLILGYPELRVWLLEGDLAAGKTELVKGLAKALGMDDEISSPTFAYLKEYGNELAHYDLYRLEGPDEELLHLISEHIEGPGFTVLEWPSRMKLQLDQAHLKIEIHHQGGNERLFKLTPCY